MPADAAKEGMAGAWLRGASKGDREALNQLFLEFRDPLYRILLPLADSQEDAEEALQDTFLRIWRSKSPYDPAKSSPFHYLVTIGRRILIDRRRKRSRRIVTVHQEQSESVIDPISGVYKDNLDLHAMSNLLQQLPKAQAEAILLAFREGMNQPEISQKLGRPLGTVKSDIRRGMARLRQLYREVENAG